VTTKLDKVFGRQCPQLHRAIFGKRYTLPQYRIADYENQDTLNRQMQSWFVAASLGRINFRDDLNSMLLSNHTMALCYDRPVLYAERELCAALERTDLPDLTTADFRWKWPQLRIVLPLGTISRAGQEHSVTHLDMFLVQGQQKVNLPEPIRTELHAMRAELPLVENRLSHSTFNLIAPSNGSEVGPTFYSYRAAWNDQKLHAFGQGKLPTACASTDKSLTDRAVRLGLNLLLLLSATPWEYEPEHYERPPRIKGDHLKAGLARAHFVGQQLYRARPSPKKSTENQLQSAGRHCASHFACGHWRRTACGKGRRERRLKWISVYFAGGKEEHAMDESANETRTT